jgi:D-3-phosphoglycerate dehydrogenase / 2-oxoglutarate reductase
VSTAGTVAISDYELPADGRLQARLREAGLEVVMCDADDEDELERTLADAVALIVQWRPITAQTLAHAGRLRIISRLGIGYDMIDVAAATELGIAVANTPHYCVEEVAAHSIAMALYGLRCLGELDGSLRRGAWSPHESFAPACGPKDAPFAVIGYGRIGSRVAAIAGALGFPVLVHDPHLPADSIARHGAQPVSLQEALERARIVSLHVPLDPSTRALIDARALASMRRDAFLVNTCRGGLIDELALVRALQDGALAGAALDVFEQEPLSVESPLREAPRLLLTPHAAWFSPQALLELPMHAAENVIRFLSGEPVASVVNAAELAERAGSDGSTPRSDGAAQALSGAEASEVESH